MAVTAAALAVGSAGTATAASTAGLFGAAGSFSLMQTVSTVGAVGGIFSSLAAGNAQQKIANSQARLEEVRAREEEIRGRQEAAQIKDDLATSIAAANARGAGMGIDYTSGSSQVLIGRSARDAQRASEIVLSNSSAAADARRVNAETTRNQGKNAKRSSRINAIGIASDYAMKQQDRGGFAF